MAMVPPGRSTRASSAMACSSSGMCSRISEAMTRSKVPSANGSAQRVALHRTDPGGHRVQLAGVGHGPERVPDVAHLVGPEVDGHHLGAQPGRLVGVAAEAAAEVEHPVAGAHAQSGVVDGQHRPASTSSSRARYSAGRCRPPSPAR